MSQNFRIIHLDSLPASASPYRLLDSQDQEVSLINDFLDMQCIRGLSPRSVRAYGYDLLNFTRWWLQRKQQDLSRLNESRVHDYVRFQLDSKPKPTPQTVNHRLIVLSRLYRFHYGRDIPTTQSTLGHTYTTRNPFAYGKRRYALARLRLKEPQRVVTPLSPEEVSQAGTAFVPFAISVSSP